MVSESVPPADEDAEPRRLSRTAFIAIVAGVAGACLAIGAWFVPTPWVVFAPGSVRDVEGIVDVDGELATPSSGELFFTTAQVHDANVYDLVWAWLDSAVELEDKEEFYGDQDPGDRDRANQLMMDDSKEVATAVALELLGFDVPEHGSGAFVEIVVDDSPADGALVPGDTITSIDGESIDTETDAVEVLGDLEPGEEVEVEFDPIDTSETDTDSVEVTLAEHPDEPGRAMLGVQLATRDQSFEYPFEIEIDSGSVSGPSAGLAFTLAVIDVLSPTDLTGGREIAVTGEITPAGDVLSIGALHQKVATVERAGVDVFIVPASQNPDDLAEAIRLAGDDVEIVPVETVQDAIDYLAPDGLERPERA